MGRLHSGSALRTGSRKEQLGRRGVQNVNVHASSAQVEPVQSPPFAQLKVQVDPASHVAFAHTEPGLVQTSAQVAPGSQVTFHPPQSPPSAQESRQNEPAGQVTSPEQTAPVELQSRLHI
jgi:hypothetical protein